jgi:hypothetical protein
LAFLRFNRDKRGYEHFYLVQPRTNRRGKTRARVLYWYRTPPGVKVGREPFDTELRRTLEAQNPGVVFDWPKIIATPLPSADVERWRERRRAEKAEKAARRALRADGLAAEAGSPVPNAVTETTEEIADDVTGQDVDDDDDGDDVPEAAAPENPSSAQAPAEGLPGSVPPSDGRRRRRRRRGRRGRNGPPQVAAPSAEASAPPEPHEPNDPSGGE